jgi:hypothetical protein
VNIPNNSHNSAAPRIDKDGNGATNQVQTTTASGDAADQEQKKEPASHRKEKSVLQTKLTRLAIQIGYAGQFV